MRFQLLIVWWLLVPMALLGFSALGYLLYNQYKHGSKLELFAWIRRTALFVLLVLMLLGPSIPGGSSAPGVANLDVVIAVDTTSSMGAQDYAGSKLRLDGAKQDILALAEKLRGAHFAVITFDSKANVALPFTSDSGSFTSAIQSINREIYGTSKGSSIDKPIDTIKQQLTNSKTAHPERGRLLFYLGDGEQTIKSDVKSFKDLAPLVQGGGVLGYGTAEGSKMLRYTGLDDTKSDQYVNVLDSTTKKFVPAVSKIDETALQKIAAELSVTYHNRNKGGTVDGVYSHSQAQLLIDKSKRVVHYLNLYWLVAIPLAGLLFWEWQKVLLLVIQFFREERKHHA